MQALLLDALSAGAIGLTANQRLSRTWREAYDRHHQAAGRLAWTSAQVMPWPDWLRRCAQESLLGASEPVTLLRPAQERSLWESIIADDEEARGLLQPAPMAAAAMQAWDLLHAHRLRLTDPAFATQRDTEAFRRWADVFSQRCQEQHWLDSSRLADHVARAWQQELLTPPRQILLGGFDEFTPQQQSLLAVLQDRGTRVRQVEWSAAHRSEAYRQAYRNREEELLAAAHWARQRVEARALCRIGVVVPDLEARRATVERTFSAVLHPDKLAPGHGEWRAAFHVSLGRPLSEDPVVPTAFGLLELALGTVPLGAAGALLRSPFWGGAQAEMSCRALLDAHLRAQGRREVGLPALREAASDVKDDGSPQPYACPILADLLARCLDRQPGEGSRRPPSGWRLWFGELLDAVEWHKGGRTLTSPENQAVRAWKELLAEFGSLDLTQDGRGLTGPQALSRLRQMARERTFQPENEGAPIEVVGMLEAAGATFDELWVMGLHDEAWPSPAKANPFLPLSLQRRHNLPHASPARELAFAAMVTGRLLGSAPRVWFSYPSMDDDRELRPSPLLVDLPELPVTDPPELLSWWAHLRPGTYSLEQRTDEQAPAVPAGAMQKGGAALFEHQAACPFRAFAECRLGVHPLPRVQDGLSVQQRGTVLHGVLEHFWEAVRTHAELMALTDEAAARLVSECVQRALADKSRGASSFDERVLAIERERLQKLVLAWLAVERERAPFTVVRPEGERTVTLAGIPVRARIDRIDRLADGRLVVIDYKSSAPDVRDWEGARPEAPQLPLYCATVPGELAGVLFGQLRAGRTGFHGYAAEDGLVPRVNRFAQEGRTLMDQVRDWSAVLETLAQEFREGKAWVDPKHPRQSCERCTMHALCRIHERQAMTGPVSEAE